MELMEYFNIVRKRWTVVLLITLVSTLISALVSYFVIQPVYKADISVIISNVKSSEDDSSQNYNDVLMYQRMVKSYVEIAKTRMVAEDVVDALKLDITNSQLLNMISVSSTADTEFLKITVKSADPKLARDIANQYAKSLKAVSKDVRGVDNVQLMDEALIPTMPDSPRPLLNTAIAFFLGLMLSIGVIFLIEYLDNTVKRQDEIEKYFGIPVIGAIPLVNNDK